LPNLNTAVCNTVSQQAQTDLQILWSTCPPVLRNYTRCNSDDALHSAALFIAAICFNPKFNKLISKTHDN